MQQLQKKALLSRKNINEILKVENPILYYAGMGDDVYTPFIIFDAKLVIAVDILDCRRTNELNEMDKQRRIWTKYNYVREAIHELNHHSDHFVEIINVKFNDAKYQFSIQFELNGIRRTIIYNCFKDFYTSWIPELSQYPISAILTFGAEVSFNGNHSYQPFDSYVRRKWENVGIVISLDNCCDLKTDEACGICTTKNWSIKERFEIPRILPTWLTKSCVYDAFLRLFRQNDMSDQSVLKELKQEFRDNFIRNERIAFHYFNNLV